MDFKTVFLFFCMDFWYMDQSLGRHLWASNHSLKPLLTPQPTEKHSSFFFMKSLFTNLSEKILLTPPTNRRAGFFNEKSIHKSFEFFYCLPNQQKRKICFNMKIFDKKIHSKGFQNGNQIFFLDLCVFLLFFFFFCCWKIPKNCFSSNSTLN